ncbi:DUF4184 family protein [Microlunatus ginsengisoli]|uniref:DUF4184 family protein n=1 Tax=Microlunatus ginsengisoli TaxID=363863 RepID=A0ABP7AQD1_9ACTN
MPFTPAHVAAILPFTVGRPGRWLVPAALAIGAMIPDLPYFLPAPARTSEVSHAWYGPITLDLINGIGLWIAWELLLRVPLADASPAWLRLRLPPRTPLDPGRCVAAGVSVLIGAASHVLWDAFTHADRWGTTRMPALNDVVGGLPVYKWLQFGSGLLGMLVLAVWFGWWLRRTPRRDDPSPDPAADRRRRLAWGLLGAVVLVAPPVIWATAAEGSLERTAFLTVTRSIGVVAIALILLCLVWPNPKPAAPAAPAPTAKADQP